MTEKIQGVQPIHHTPGPWGIETGTWRYLVLNAQGYPVCTVAIHPDGNKYSKEADARLIAAAPELLEALVRLMRSFPTDGDMDELGWNAKEIDEACNAHDAARAVFCKATRAQA